MELLKDILQIIIYTIITGCGVIVTAKIVDFFNNKVDELQTNTKLAEYDKVNKMIDKAQDTITDIVTKINQIFVNDLKNSGEFTKESAEEAKNKALAEAKILINQETASVIETVHGSYDEWLDTIIEKAVHELKLYD